MFLWEHPNIRSVDACYKSSSLAVSLVKNTKPDFMFFMFHRKEQII